MASVSLPQQKNPDEEENEFLHSIENQCTVIQKAILYTFRVAQVMMPTKKIKPKLTNRLMKFHFNGETRKQRKRNDLLRFPSIERHLPWTWSDVCIFFFHSMKVLNTLPISSLQWLFVLFHGSRLSKVPLIDDEIQPVHKPTKNNKKSESCNTIGMPKKLKIIIENRNSCLFFCIRWTGREHRNSFAVMTKFNFDAIPLLHSKIHNNNKIVLFPHSKHKFDIQIWKWPKRWNSYASHEMTECVRFWSNRAHVCNRTIVTLSMSTWVCMYYKMYAHSRLPTFILLRSFHSILSSVKITVTTSLTCVRVLNARECICANVDSVMHGTLSEYVWTRAYVRWPEHFIAVKRMLTYSWWNSFVIAFFARFLCRHCVSRFFRLRFHSSFFTRWFCLVIITYSLLLLLLLFILVLVVVHWWPMWFGSMPRFTVVIFRCLFPHECDHRFQPEALQRFT